MVLRNLINLVHAFITLVSILVNTYKTRHSALITQDKTQEVLEITIKILQPKIMIKRNKTVVIRATVH